MSTTNTRTSGVSADQVFDAVAAALFGGGLLTMVLFPFALPIILLVVVPLVPIAIVTALAGAIVASPWLLFRLARSLLGRARGPAGLVLVSETTMGKVRQ